MTSEHVAIVVHIPGSRQSLQHRRVADAEVQPPILFADPATRLDLRAAPVLYAAALSVAEIVFPVGVADTQREPRAQVQIHVFLAAPDMGYPAAHEAEAGARAGQRFGRDRRGGGQTPDAAPRRPGRGPGG